MLMPIDLPPGQYRNGTILQSAGRWRDASLVRWYDGTIRPVGGWQPFSGDDLPFKARASLAWRSNAGVKWLAAGAADKLVVYDEDAVLYDITPAGLAVGREDAVLANGYGGGLYGRGPYGRNTESTDRVLNASIWTLANWGQDLIACYDMDGRIFTWSLNTAADATLVAAAPTSNAAVFVTQERFLFALGASGNARLVKWSDREDYTVWTPSATNEAGDFVLNTVGQIMCAVALRGQTLILTDQDAHTATYVGPQLVYEFEQVGQACGVISRNAAVAVDGGAVWMGFGNFLIYSGGSVKELPCDVADYVFGNMSRIRASHVCTMQVAEFSEIWWFYPSTDATENDSYVTYNYAQGTWATGSLSRTTGVDRGVFFYPLMFGSDLTVYRHEVGTVPTGFPVYAETGPIAPGAGDTTFTALRLYPDEGTQGDVTATFKTRYYPNGPESTHGPYTLAAPTSVRFTGRQMAMRIDGGEGKDWRFGVQRIDVEQRGRR